MPSSPALWFLAGTLYPPVCRALPVCVPAFCVLRNCCKRMYDRRRPLLVCALCLQQEALQQKLAAALEAKRKQDEENRVLAAERKKAEVAAAAVSVAVQRCTLCGLLRRVPGSCSRGRVYKTTCLAVCEVP